MNLLTRELREQIANEICMRYHKDGLRRLKVTGHFEKYTPLFHFRIAEPCKDDFIFITELFGDIGIKKGLMSRGLRLQYHGNFNGLSRILVHGIHNGMIVPSDGNICVNPMFRLEADKRNIDDEDRKKFDGALLYLNHVLRYTIPETRRFDVNPETFSDTYYIF
jgi:hypothetical protein